MNWKAWRDTEHRHPANIARHDNNGRAVRFSDALTNKIGTLTFVGWSTLVIIAWAGLNTTGLFIWHWDPYPFVFLNLAFSAFAFYSAPLILMSQNRQSEHDRVKAEEDYRINHAHYTLGRATFALLTTVAHRIGVETPEKESTP